MKHNVSVWSATSDSSSPFQFSYLLAVSSVELRLWELRAIYFPGRRTFSCMATWAGTSYRCWYRSRRRLTCWRCSTSWRSSSRNSSTAASERSVDSHKADRQESPHKEVSWFKKNKNVRLTLSSFSLRQRQLGKSASSQHRCQTPPALAEGPGTGSRSAAEHHALPVASVRNCTGRNDGTTRWVLAESTFIVTNSIDFDLQETTFLLVASTASTSKLNHGHCSVSRSRASLSTRKLKKFYPI